MNAQINVTVNFGPETLALIQSFFSSVKSEVKTSTAEEPVKKSPKKKEGEEVKEPSGEKKEDTKKISVETVRQKTQEVNAASTANRAKIKDIQAEFGATKVAELKESDYAAYLEKLNAI